MDGGRAGHRLPSSPLRNPAIFLEATRAVPPPRASGAPAERMGSVLAAAGGTRRPALQDVQEK